jgi:uncharacterized membrane protein YidH (DUF202 family)
MHDHYTTEAIASSSRTIGIRLIVMGNLLFNLIKTHRLNCIKWMNGRHFVIPAKAGIQFYVAFGYWIPAFGGMTIEKNQF